MKKLLFTSTALMLALSLVAQQRPQTPPQTPGTGAPAQGPNMGNLANMMNNAQRQGPKPYKEVITAKAVSKTGLFTVHKVEDKYYFEIPDSLFGREILSVVRFAKVPAGAGYGGEIANQQTITFEKGPNNNVFLRTVTLVNKAEENQDIYKAVTNSNLNAIASAFPVASLGKDSTGVVIDVTAFFSGDNQAVSVNPNIKRRYSLTALAQDRSYISKISTYPINTEIVTVKTFNASAAAGPSIPGLPTGGASLAAARDAGAVTMEINTSLLLLPKVPMQRRIADKRVGYFTDDFVRYSDTQQKVEELSFAVRWRLEPKDGEWEKWE